MDPHPVDGGRHEGRDHRFGNGRANTGNQADRQGHDLIPGTRDPNKLDDKKMLGATLREWKSQTEGGAHSARIATFKEAAAHGELLINATSGLVSYQYRMDTLAISGW